MLIMAVRRKDNKNRVLKEGEYQRSNGTYEFKWRDKCGDRHSIYAKTLDELRGDIRKGLQENAERKAESDRRTAAIEKAAENITVDIPPVMIDNRVTTMIQEMALRLEQQGMKLEQYLQYTGTDIEKLREDYRETAEKNVRTDLMLDEVAKAEDIKVEAEDLDREVAEMAAAYGVKPKDVRKIIREQRRLADLAVTVLHKKTAQFIIDNIAE